MADLRPLYIHAPTTRVGDIGLFYTCRILVVITCLIPRLPMIIEVIEGQVTRLLNFSLIKKRRAGEPANFVDIVRMISGRWFAYSSEKTRS